MDANTEGGYKPPFSIKLMIGYLYFTQGIYLSFISSVMFLYPAFPDAHMLSNFSIIALPFSFKFLTGPIVEKYSI
jgi:hypothetical protein